MVYKNQGCQVIRPDSVNLLDLNDYNISGDLRCLTWMHHKQLLDVMHFKMIADSDTKRIIINSRIQHILYSHIPDTLI